MTVLVTGASGLIGRHLVSALLARGDTVRTFQRGVPSELPRGVENVPGDVRTDQEALSRAAGDCAAVVHLAGRGDVTESRQDPVGYAQLNATGALRALEAARVAGAVFVLASTQRVYPLGPEPCREDVELAPDSPYGYAKWVAELWARMMSEHFGVTTRVLRFFSVYGPGQQANGNSGVVSIFVRNALAGRPLQVQSGGKRDFTDARDAAAGILRAIDLAADGAHRTFNIATGHGTSFGDLARLVVTLTGARVAIEEDLREPCGHDLVADIDRARTMLEYAPTIGLRDGLADYIAWERERV